MFKLKAPLILNVDDNEPTRYVITRTLRNAHFEVAEAGTGEEAMRLLKERSPDLILLDVHLPDVNGIDLCKRIKSDPQSSRIPVLQMSATVVNMQDRVRGLDGGAESYLIQPVEPELLLATIRALLRAREAEALMREMAVQWQTTFDAINDAVLLLDAEGRILRCNSSVRQIFEEAPEQLIGRTCDSLWDPAVIQAEGLAFTRMLRSGRREEMDLRHHKRWMHVTVDPVRSENGTVEGAVYIVCDITDRRRLEEKIRQAQKSESIGQLAGGVAHDFNNLLTAILGNTSLALSSLSTDNPVRDLLLDVESASRRAADLTQQLLAYSGKGRFVPRSLDLSGLVNGMQDLIEAAIPRKLELLMHLDANLPRVYADPSQMQQLVMNLAMNAAEAMGKKRGRIRISTGLERVESKEGSELQPGSYVFLEIQDTGCGMDEQVQAKMFDPFFSTKFVGRGLGLSAAAGIVRSHSGAIRAHSEPDKGTIFRVLLPVMEPEAEAAAPLSLRGTGKILVVDDQEFVRRFASHTLKAYGYDVVMAANGKEAIQVIRDSGDSIAAAILDMTMPVMTGDEALQEMAALNPRLRVIVSTGYDSNEAKERFAKYPVYGFLFKPYSARQLAETVRAALSGDNRKPL
ncbi:MAG: response regulator [Bryobacteraceae bacterium]